MRFTLSVLGIQLILMTFIGSQSFAENNCFQNLATLTETVQYSEEWFEFRWNKRNPPKIEPGGLLTLRVTGGRPPYKWFHDSEGPSPKFYFDVFSTAEPHNTLVATDTACGAVTITVKDANGTEVSGDVLCTVGMWPISKGEDCYTSFPGYEDIRCGPYSQWDTIEEGFVYIQHLGRNRMIQLSWGEYRSGTCSDRGNSFCLYECEYYGTPVAPNCLNVNKNIFEQFPESCECVDNPSGESFGCWSVACVEQHQWRCPL